MQNNEAHLNEQIQNFSEFSERIEEVRRRAATDALTGLASFTKGASVLHGRLDAAEPTTVILIDLDHFKQVNELWGYRCGNQVLSRVGEILTAYADGHGDVACRWEGDKFLVISQSSQEALSDAAITLRTLLCKRYAVDGGENPVEIDVSVSIGLASAARPESMAAILARAGEHLSANRNASQVVTGETQASEVVQAQ